MYNDTNTNKGEFVVSVEITGKQFKKFLFPSTGSQMLPEESIEDLKLELLLVSRMFRSTPTTDIDKFVVFGMSKQDFIAKIYNVMYTRISYPVDCMLDKIVNSYEEEI
jgi:hypothetical protein